MKTRTYTITQPNEFGQEIVVFEITIDEPEGVVYKNIEWDSKTGLVTANIETGEIISERRPIPCSGKSLGTLQPSKFTAKGISDIQYSYWYN